MVLEIDRSSSARQLIGMNSAFARAATNIYTTKTAIEAFINNPELCGQAYDSYRTHYTGLHFPVLQGMICYIDEMLADNVSYNNNLGTLKACYLNEAVLSSQLEQAQTLDVMAESALPAFHSLTQRLIRTVREKLDSLYLFESVTQSLYQTAQSLLEDVKIGIALIEASLYDANTKSFSCPPGMGTDMSWRDRLISAWNEKQTNGMKALDLTGDVAAVKGFDPCYAYSTDPVNLSTGNFIYAHEDMTVTGLSPLSLIRFYNARDTRQGVLGSGWVHNYEMSLAVKSDVFILTQEDGQEETFVKITDDLYVNGNTGLESIRIEEEGYVYTTPEQMRHTFDRDGRELCRQDPNGNRVHFYYNEHKQLLRVESANVFFIYSYTEEGRLGRVTDHSGRQVTFAYEDEGGNLTSVTDLAGHTIHYIYDAQNKITAITSARGVHSVSNDYDSGARIIRQHFPDGGSMHYSYNDARHSVTLVEQNGNQITYVHDDKYRNVKTVYANGEEEFAYNSQNMPTRHKDRLGHVTRCGYDHRGNLIKVTDPLTNTFEQTYTRHNKPLKFSVNGELKIQNQYDAQGNLSQMTDALHRSTRFTYNVQGRPVTVTQADGSTMSFAYDDQSNLAAITDVMGQTTRYEYDGLNRVVRTTDPKGNATQYAYDSCHNLIKVTNAEGQERHYAYNENNKITEITDFDGTISRQEYALLNKPVKIIDALGNMTHIEYDIMWNIKTYTDPSGAVTRFTYTPYNQLESITNPVGAVTRFEYDANGNRTKIIGPHGQAIQYAYDALNRLIKLTEPDGTAATRVYDAEGRVIQTIDTLGNERHYSYDAAGQTIRATAPLGRETSYTYTALGKIQTATDAKGGVTRYDYYPGGRLKSVTLPEGERETYIYDRNGNVKTMTDALGNVTELFYDTLNRVIAVKNPQGGSKHFAYDAVGNITEVTDENGHKTHYAYSLLGDITEVTDALGHSTQYAYDKARRLSKVEQYRLIGDDAAVQDALVTTYERDKTGAITAIRAPLDRTTRFCYDSLGNVVAKTDEEGMETLYEYNTVNKLSKIAYADGRTVELTYSPLRQLIEIKDWLGVTTVMPDALGRVTAISDYEGKTVSYTWDELNNKTRITYPDASAVDYAYNASGRLVGVRSAQGETRYGYNVMGQLVRTEHPNNVTSTCAYHPTGRLSQLRHEQDNVLLDEFCYTYDPAGLVIQIDKYRRDMPEDDHGWTADNGVFRYAYDPVGRMTEALHGNMRKEYSYDSLGNRVASYGTREEMNLSYEYNAANQLVCSQGRNEVNEYRYDRRGNLTEVLVNGASKTRYTFDATNMLTQSYTEKGSAQYTYDGLRNRVKRLEQFADAAPETRYISDLTRPYDNLLQTHTKGVAQTDGQSLIRNYFWGNTLLGADGQEAVTYLADHQGSPIRLMNARDHAAHKVLAYDEFGVPVPSPGGHEERPGRGGENPFGYAGFQAEETSGLYYAQARYYEPQAGRFIAGDTHWTSQNMIYGDCAHIMNGTSLLPNRQAMQQQANLYSYGLNNPVSYVDKSGASIIDALRDGAEAVGDGISSAGSAIGDAFSDGARAVGDAGSYLWNNYIYGEATSIVTEIKTGGEGNYGSYALSRETMTVNNSNYGGGILVRTNIINPNNPSASSSSLSFNPGTLNVSVFGQKLSFGGGVTWSLGSSGVSTRYTLNGGAGDNNARLNAVTGASLQDFAFTNVNIGVGRGNDMVGIGGMATGSILSSHRIYSFHQHSEGGLTLYTEAGWHVKKWVVDAVAAAVVGVVALAIFAPEVIGILVALGRLGSLIGRLGSIIGRAGGIIGRFPKFTFPSPLPAMCAPF